MTAQERLTLVNEVMGYRFMKSGSNAFLVAPDGTLLDSAVLSDHPGSYSAVAQHFGTMAAAHKLGLEDE